MLIEHPYVAYCVHLIIGSWLKKNLFLKKLSPERAKEKCDKTVSGKKNNEREKPGEKDRGTERINVEQTLPRMKKKSLTTFSTPLPSYSFRFQKTMNSAKTVSFSKQRILSPNCSWSNYEPPKGKEPT